MTFLGMRGYGIVFLLFWHLLFTYLMLTYEIFFVSILIVGAIYTTKEFRFANSLLILLTKYMVVEL